jgi:CheY-like chemotaxis protein
MANVVIAGGSEEAQLILRGLLRLHQHRVVGASLSAPTALELVRQATDPVLLVDSEMSTPAWTEFVPQARRANPATRVVLLTPTRSARIEGQARSLGVAALVRRPFAIQELLSALGPTGPSPAGPSGSAPPASPPPDRP